MCSAILCYPDIAGYRPQYPTGLYRIASYCWPRHRVYVLDARLEHPITGAIDKILDADRDISCLGLSVMTGEQIASAMELSRVYHGRLKVTWGGVHPTMLPRQVLDSEYVDYVIIGEGEEAFSNLLDHLSGGSISTRAFQRRQDSGFDYNFMADLDTGDYVDFDRYPIRPEYFVKRDGFERAFSLETSRGCPHSCAFCHNSVFPRPYRTVSPELIFNIVDKLISLYHVDGIVFQEDNFFVKRGRVNQYVENLRRRTEVGWKANARVDYFLRLVEDASFMEGLIESGCRVLQFGLESGSSRILKLINKGFSADAMVSLNKKLAAFPIQVKYNFIVGFPGETRTELHETLTLIERLTADNPQVVPPFVNVYSPYPGTPLYREALAHGFREPNSLDGWAKVNWSEPCLTWRDAEMPNLIRRIVAEYRSRVAYVS